MYPRIPLAYDRGSLADARSTLWEPLL